MFYGSVAFAVFLLAVVAIKYLAPKPTGCPQCSARRQGDHPLCIECGWIFDVEDDDDDDTIATGDEIEGPWAS
ncbi:MAG: hypothetical protein HOM68_07865 [Gemmatimonadetes bacterium]|nr:hypothetical protein [Gemmatimonadota bacterium]MBT4610168.1 hypothetical protein [Gemmatimonadota bacterium]MBT5056441.1 hypothetical protein [Gemmatimonadota bacterium]MBT5144194.1 hypothetical protein [Gemmatimonadota bacterium]MBT5588780.1 hypothetical protein [Gemmatimonadota bacterium]